MKTKFKMTKREMLDFNDDCNNAANRCPQYRNHWNIEDRVILLGEIKPKDLVKHWKQCDALWGSGYHECLSLDSLEVFKEYKRYKIVRKAEKLIEKEDRRGNGC